MIIIGITLIVGAIGGIANAILAVQARKAARKVIKAAGLDPVKDAGSDEEKTEDTDTSKGDDVTGF
jgi:hypothetical protein